MQGTIIHIYWGWGSQSFQDIWALLVWKGQDQHHGSWTTYVYHLLILTQETRIYIVYGLWWELSRFKIFCHFLFGGRGEGGGGGRRPSWGSLPTYLLMCLDTRNKNIYGLGWDLNHFFIDISSFLILYMLMNHTLNHYLLVVA